MLWVSSKGPDLYYEVYHEVRRFGHLKSEYAIRAVAPFSRKAANVTQAASGAQSNSEFS